MRKAKLFLLSLLVPLSAACATDVVGEDATSEELDPDPSGQAATSITWPTLFRGDFGDVVAAAQFLLRARGQNVSADADFGGGTEAATISFQRSKGLSADGVIGGATWEALISDVAAGSAGAAVQAAQQLLVRAGISVVVDGSAGPGTVAAIKSFQKSKCLGETGVVGRFTWNSLVAGRSYCTGGGGAGAGDLLSAHNAGSLTLWDRSFDVIDGADPLSNIRDVAAGRLAKNSCYGNAPCSTTTLSSNMLSAMNRLRTEYGYRYFVTAIAGASHSPGSAHYSGRAVDIDEVNGVRILGDSATARNLMAACTQLGAVLVLGPNNDPDHQDHIHCGF